MNDNTNPKLSLEPRSRADILKFSSLLNVKPVIEISYLDKGMAPSSRRSKDAIGWTPSTGEWNIGTGKQGSEDEIWEREQVQEHLDKVMRKAATQWIKRCISSRRIFQRG